MFKWSDVPTTDDKPREIKYTPEHLKERREININNKWMFPDSAPQSMNW